MKIRCRECDNYFDPADQRVRCWGCVSSDCRHCEGMGRFPPDARSRPEFKCKACDGKGKERGHAHYKGWVDLTDAELDDLRIVCSSFWVESDIVTGRNIRLSERMMDKLLNAKPDLKHTLKQVKPLE